MEIVGGGRTPQIASALTSYAGGHIGVQVPNFGCGEGHPHLVFDINVSLLFYGMSCNTIIFSHNPLLVYKDYGHTDHLKRQKADNTAGEGNKKMLKMVNICMSISPTSDTLFNHRQHST